MHLLGSPEEEAVEGHRIRDARAHENRRVQGPEYGNEHEDGEDGAPNGAEERSSRRLAGIRSIRQLPNRQRVEIHRVHQQIDDRTDPEAQE